MDLPACFDPDVVEREVIFLLSKAAEAKRDALQKFGRNTIDPFGALFELAGFSLSHRLWKESETARQAQKSLQNHIGTFHQKILGSAPDWENLQTGKVVDLKSDQHKIIAEIKNKHNTLSGGELSGLYYSLDKSVSPKTSIYKDYTAYYVTIIPRKPERMNCTFTPSDKEKGTRCASNERIRIIDGASFYDLVFKEKDALKKLYTALPQILSGIANTDSRFSSIASEDCEVLQTYFENAFP